MDAYQLTAQKRFQKRLKAVEKRREKANQIARTAAALLKKEFGAVRVAIFGSLLKPQLFHRRSDVDLAVWGLRESDYFRAVSQLLSLDPDIAIDLIEMEHAPQRLLEKIEREGQLL